MGYLKIYGWVALALFTLSCATYQDRVQPGVDLVRSGQVDEAVTHFEQLTQDEKSRDRLAYLLEYATVLQIAGRYQESSKVFIQADKLSEQLDYISISQNTLSALSSEEMIQYKGESYEKIMINAMNALNFIALNDIDSALVEVRRIDEKVKKYKRDNRESYEFNPFASYLSGVLYESLRKWDDAYIAYLKTANLTGASNPFLLSDLNRVAKLSDRTTQLQKEGFYQRELEKQSLGSPGCEAKARCGRLVLIFLQGWGPVKSPQLENPRYPTLLPSFNRTKVLEAEVTALRGAQKRTLQTQTVYNLEQAAIDTLVADQAALVARRFGSAIAKDVVAEQIRQKDELLGFLAWIFMHMSDRADLRQWASLPQTIQMAQLDLPIGDWQLNSKGFTSALEIAEVFAEQKISIQPGKTRFVILRSKK